MQVVKRQIKNEIIQWTKKLKTFHLSSQRLIISGMCFSLWKHLFRGLSLFIVGFPFISDF